MSQPIRRWRVTFRPAFATSHSPKPAIAACRSAAGWRWRRWRRNSRSRAKMHRWVTSRRGGGFADGGVDPRHDFFGHQLHGALVQCRLDPVHAGVDQLAEVADLFAEREDLVNDVVDAAVDHAVI